jgi:hypothetical protein
MYKHRHCILHCSLSFSASEKKNIWRVTNNETLPSDHRHIQTFKNKEKKKIRKLSHFFFFLCSAY